MSSAVGDLVEKIAQVPDPLRRFTVTEEMGRRVHRVGPDLLAELLDHGMACAGNGSERLYDAYDLGNAALHLGLMSVQRRTIRSWGTALRTAVAEPGGSFRVDVVGTCPVPGHPGECAYDVLQSDGGRRRFTSPTPTEASLGQVVVTPGAGATLPAEVRGLLGELKPVEFFLLPEGIRWDHGFLWETRMADCGGTADWAVREGERRGLPVRFAFGLLLARPYSTPHCWAEFRVGDAWVAVDPLMIRAMHQWGGLDPALVPEDAPFSPVVHRMSDHFTKISSHGGIWSAVSLRTEKL